MPLSIPALAGWLLIYATMALLPLMIAMGLTRPEPRPLLVEAGAMLGLLGLGMLAAQLVVTGRFRWFAARAGQDNLLQFHRRVGVSVWLILVAHPVLLIAGDREFLAWLDPREDALRATAIAGLAVALTLLVVTSLWRVQLRLQYEHWRVLHAVLAFCIVVGGLGHALMASHHTGGLLTAALLTLLIAAPLLLLVDLHFLRPRRLARKPWRVVTVEPRRADALRLILEADGHSGLRFRAGQFAWLTLGARPGALQQHPFSLASSPFRPDRIEMVIKQVGDFTRALAQVTPGTRAFLDGPYGVFCEASDSERRAVYVVGGIGITPVLSMLRARAERGCRQPVWLIYANQSEADIVMRESVESLCDFLPATLVHVIAEPSSQWTGERGYVDAVLLQRHLPEDAPDIDYFVCGPEPLMDVTEKALRDRGVSLFRLYSERFDLV